MVSLGSGEARIYILSLILLLYLNFIPVKECFTFTSKKCWLCKASFARFQGWGCRSLFSKSDVSFPSTLRTLWTLSVHIFVSFKPSYGLALGWFLFFFCFLNWRNGHCPHQPEDFFFFKLEKWILSPPTRRPTRVSSDGSKAYRGDSLLCFKQKYSWLPGRWGLGVRSNIPKDLLNAHKDVSLFIKMATKGT